MIYCYYVINYNEVFLSFPESGADPTIESDSGFNAMDMAVAMGHRNGRFSANMYTAPWLLNKLTLPTSNHQGAAYRQKDGVHSDCQHEIRERLSSYLSL